MDRTQSATVQGTSEERQQRLADRLREVREYLGLSQQFVAEHTGIPRLAISAIENGKRKVEALELAALAALYHYPVTYFLDEAFSDPPTVRALAREANSLTHSDQEQVLRFAQFLKTYGRARQQGSSGTAKGIAE